MYQRQRKAYEEALLHFFFISPPGNFPSIHQATLVVPVSSWVRGKFEWRLQFLDNEIKSRASDKGASALASALVRRVDAGAKVRYSQGGWRWTFTRYLGENDRATSFPYPVQRGQRRLLPSPKSRYGSFGAFTPDPGLKIYRTVKKLSLRSRRSITIPIQAMQRQSRNGSPNPQIEKWLWQKPHFD